MFTKYLSMTLIVFLLGPFVSFASAQDQNGDKASNRTEKIKANTTTATPMVTPTNTPATPGDVDPTFNPILAPDEGVSAIQIQADGKIVIAGRFATINGISHSRFARLNGDGSLDSTFNVVGGLNTINSNVLVLKSRADNKTLVGGIFSSIGGVQRKSLARLHADGTVDTAFDPGELFNLVYDLAIQPDGKIIACGVDFEGHAKIARLNTDGRADPTLVQIFDVASVLQTLAIQPDGKILVGGFFFYSVAGTGYNNVARLNLNGSLDTSFTAQTSRVPASVITKIFLQPDGKLFISGVFDRVNEMDRNNLAKLNSDGGIDESFVPMTSGAENIMGLAIQADGKIIIGGNNFSAVPDFPAGNLARFNTNGSLDTSFATGTGVGVTGKVNALVLRSDNKLLIGGDFSHYNGTPRTGLAQVNTSGETPMPRASIAGRVMTPSGLGIRNAVVRLTDSQGIFRIATTSSFGNFAFTDVRTCESWIIGVSSRRYRFAARQITVTGDMSNVEFVGLE